MARKIGCQVCDESNRTGSNKRFHTLAAKRTATERRYPTSVDRYTSCRAGRGREGSGRIVELETGWVRRGALSGRGWHLRQNRQTSVFWAQVNKDGSGSQRKSRWAAAITATLAPTLTAIQPTVCLAQCAFDKSITGDGAAHQGRCQVSSKSTIARTTAAIAKYSWQSTKPTQSVCCRQQKYHVKA